MHNEQQLKSHIISALDALPVESLQLLVEFVTFLLAKKKRPALFEQPESTDLWKDSLYQLKHHEYQHLEQEFANYEQRFPIE